jgi:signal transduction histidine kinase
MPASSERNASIGAVIVVAILFAPLRTMVQRMIDQAFYGTRSDPAGTAWQVGEGLRQHDDLPGMLDQTRTALRLPWMALRDGASGADIASSGTLDGTPVVDIPLTYRGADVGALALGLRRGDRVLHDADRRTLDLIATPLAVALHATSLSEQVRKARTATAEAAAAERARLQRELHDGVGPALTSVAFQADAAFNLIRSDPEEAERLLADVRSDLRGAADDVRRVVYGLHPIELDEVGLVGAIRERLFDTAAEQIRGVTVALDAPDELPELSPAVELAAYRIVNEALTNVFRHSDAHQCLIRLTIDSDLEITIRDDGTVPSSWTPGVGLRSIMDRAEEVGGSATAGPTNTGWEVMARLPLDRREASAQH